MPLSNLFLTDAYLPGANDTPPYILEDMYSSWCALQQTFYNWSTAETRSYAKATLAKRLATGDFIRGFGAAWGLIPLFAPPSKTYAPASYARESIFLK